MADIRINALATTATTPASDDFLALDGTAQGTRKILATNIANNVTDVVFGTSGPSAKSSIAARAARQGLVFDGTAGATVSVPAFGTGDFTATAWVNVSSLGTTGIFGGATNAFGYYVDSTGFLVAQKRGVALILASTSTIPSNKFVLVTYTRSGTTGTHYFNGVAINSGTDATDYSVAITSVGSLVSNTNSFNGVLAPFIYNRALTAAEVVSLYEAGVPAGADYNTANNTGFVTGDNSTFASDTGFWTRGANVAITGGEAVWTGASSLNRPSISLLAGKRYLFTINITQASTNGWSWYNGSAYVSTGITGTGVQSAVLIPVANTGFYITNGDGTNGKITDLTLIPQGLLLAPDAAQAGGGLTWYDTSGNAANITLPASGVSWNVPTSASFSGGWSFGSGGGNVGIGLTNPTSGQLHIQGNSDAASGPNRPRIALTNLAGTAQTWTIQAWQTSGDANLSIYRTAAAGGILLAPTGGNVLIGTTTDGGQKLQVNGDATFAGAKITLGGSGNGEVEIRRAANSNGSSVAYRTSSTLKWYHGLRGLVNDNWYLQNEVAGNTALFFDAATSNATFAGTAIFGKAGANTTFSANGTTAESGIYTQLNTGFVFFADNASATKGIKVDVNNGGLTVLSGGLTTATAGGSAGTWKLGVYSATAPSATGYVTIDIGGTTYKLLAST